MIHRDGPQVFSRITVQDQIRVGRRVIPDQVIQFRSLIQVIRLHILHGGAVDGNNVPVRLPGVLCKQSSVPRNRRFLWILPGKEGASLLWKPPQKAKWNVPSVDAHSILLLQRRKEETIPIRNRI